MKAAGKPPRRGTGGGQTFALTAPQTRSASCRIVAGADHHAFQSAIDISLSTLLRGPEGDLVDRDDLALAELADVRVRDISAEAAGEDPLLVTELAGLERARDGCRRS